MIKIRLSIIIVYVFSFFQLFIIIQNGISSDLNLIKYHWTNTLNSSSSVRSMSLSKIYTPIADDGLVFDDNPAGLSYVEYSYLNLSGLRLKKKDVYNRYISFLSYTHPETEYTKNIAFAFANKVFLLNSDKEDRIQVANTLYLSISKQFFNKFSVGMNVKFFYTEFIENIKVYVPGIDLGIIVTAIPYIRIAVMVSDLATIAINPSSEMKFIQKIPTIFKFGVSSDFSKFWTLAFQINKNLDDKEDSVFYGGSTYFLLWEKSVVKEDRIYHKYEVFKDLVKANSDFDKKKDKDTFKSPEEIQEKENSKRKILNTRIFFNAGYNSDEELSFGFTFNVYIFKIDIGTAIQELSWDNVSIGLNFGILLH